MKKIGIIYCYFGTLPNYFNLFLNSCKNNTQIDFLIFSDCNIDNLPSNVHLFSTTFEQLKTRFENFFDFKIKLGSPYKICDFRPAFGEIFQNELKDYDFWGHSDFDIIYGRLLEFITNDILENNSKIYQFGHLTLYKNTKEVNSLYKTEPNEQYKSVFSTDNSCVFDEYQGIDQAFQNSSFSVYTKRSCADISKVHKRFTVTNIFLPQSLAKSNNFPLQVFCYENSKILRYYEKDDCISCDEFSYIHFSSRDMPVHFDGIPNAFYITKDGFFEKTKSTDLTDIKKYNTTTSEEEKAFAQKMKQKSLKRKIKKLSTLLKEKITG